MTKVINLIGGPCCGKSTLAAKLYAHMKEKRMNVEMVREVAKEWAWEGKQIGKFEQLSIIGEQIKKESSLFDKVEYIVTDSPILLGSFYFSHNHNEYFMMDMVNEYYRYCEKQDIRFSNYLLPRNKKYDPVGRFESEEDAKKIDERLVGHTAVMFFNNMTVFKKRMTDEKIIKQIMKDLK